MKLRICFLMALSVVVALAEGPAPKKDRAKKDPAPPAELTLPAGAQDGGARHFIPSPTRKVRSGSIARLPSDWPSSKISRPTQAPRPLPSREAKSPPGKTAILSGSSGPDPLASTNGRRRSRS